MRMHPAEPRHIGRRSNRSGTRFCRDAGGVRRMPERWNCMRKVSSLSGRDPLVFFLLVVSAGTRPSPKQPEVSDAGALHGDPSVTRCSLHTDMLLEDLIPRVPGGIM